MHTFNEKLKQKQKMKNEMKMKKSYFEDLTSKLCKRVNLLVFSDSLKHLTHGTERGSHSEGE